MQVLRRGSEGDEVASWERFLMGQGLFGAPVDDVFDARSAEATAEFQRRAGLSPDGVVGPRTYAAALQLGFDPGFVDAKGKEEGLGWPPPPPFRPLVSNAERAERFGEFAFQRIAPDRDDIRILGGWEEENLCLVDVPQLRGVEGAPPGGRVRFHVLVAEQVRGLFQAWEDAGLTGLLRTWQGSFAPRFVRGSRTTLSNHAWGTAFDINCAWNRLGAVPALRGEQGSVRELVPIANDHGFYWGGHYARHDGMHFEVARLRG